MSQPVPEERNDAYDLTEPPPGEHASELTDGAEPDQAAEHLQEENAEASEEHQPSQ